jgi:hypothetical protein
MRTFDLSFYFLKPLYLICEVCPKGAQLIEFLHCMYVIIDSTIKIDVYLVLV